VLARAVPGTRGARRGGEIVRILERKSTRLVGVIRRGVRTITLVPQDPRVGYLVSIPAHATGGAHDGDLVVADITRYPTSYSDIEAAIAVRLGPADDPGVETLAVIHAHELPLEFPPAVRAEAARVPATVAPSALAGRLDLRHLPLVTIDGENARDFDDAVAIESLPGDAVRLTVAVADVAAYVRWGSALDAEAAMRGTSVYFPDRVIPMLPEALSTGICSLAPGADRLAKVVRLHYASDGTPGEVEFASAVIRSAARLTYTEVARILDGADEPLSERYRALVPSLETMARLCRQLTEHRRGRGSIDFDLPEAEIVVDLRGRPENILRAERTLAHRLIEEFMLAANDAVARHLTQRGLAMIYRVHEPPGADAVAELSRFLEGFGLRLHLRDGRPTPRGYQQVLDAVAGRPEARLVNRVLLRSLTQARYATENLGHFGLASSCYTHFTSPIRRYPDLVVHRLLDLTLGRAAAPGETARLGTALVPIAAEASRRERIAMEAEREVVALKKTQFMQDKIGAELPGFVSDVVPFGFFVELEPYFVDGLVHVTTLGDDFYEHDEDAHCLRGRRTRRRFRLGDPVTVRVAGVNIERRQIDFVLAGS
jgi:ribonuclease R